MNSRSTADLVRIAAAGGGFIINGGSRSTADLVRIAAAAAQTKARINFAGMSGRSTDDLVRIGTAGAGAIEFSE